MFEAGDVVSLPSRTIDLMLYSWYISQIWGRHYSWPGMKLFFLWHSWGNWLQNHMQANALLKKSWSIYYSDLCTMQHSSERHLPGQTSCIVTVSNQLAFHFLRALQSGLAQANRRPLLGCHQHLCHYTAFRSYTSELPIWTDSHNYRHSLDFTFLEIVLQNHSGWVCQHSLSVQCCVFHVDICWGYLSADSVSNISIWCWLRVKKMTSLWKPSLSWTLAVPFSLWWTWT